MKKIELEQWEPFPGDPRRMQYAGQRVAQEVFEELKHRLEGMGYLPDEYFLMDREWENGREIPKDADIFCTTDYGGNEGVYLDVYLKWYEDSRPVTKSFITGKTLGETGADLDRMFLISSAITKAFHGDGETYARHLRQGERAEPEGMIVHLNPTEQRTIIEALVEQQERQEQAMSQTEQLLRRMTGSITAYMDEVGRYPLHISDYDKTVLAIRDGEFDAFKNLYPRVSDQTDDLLIEVAGRPGVVGGNMTLILLAAVERFSPEAYLTACTLDGIKSKTVGDGQHGTARWATKQEIRQTYAHVPFEPELWRKGEHLPEKQGLVLGCEGPKDHVTALVDTDDIHAMVTAASGAGKTAFFLYPNIEYALASGMSFLCTDTKGDLFRNYAGIAKDCYGYQIAVLDLRNPTRSDGNNLLHLINKYMDIYKADPKNLAAKAKAEKYSKILAKTLINTSGGDSAQYGQNAFFYDSAEGLLTAMFLLVAEYLPTEDADGNPIEKRHIVSVFKLVQELLAPSRVKGKNQFQLLLEKLPPNHKARWFAGSALNTAEQAMASVISTVLSRLNAFLDSEMEQILCFDTAIDAEKFCNEKSAIFIVLPEEDQTKYFMVSLILQNLYREILTVADENGGRLKNRVVFFADELGTCPPIQSLELMFSASRSRGLMLVPIVQSITGQLQKNYGKEGSEIIVDNCQVNLYGGFAPASQTAVELSKSLGSRTVMSGSISRGKNDPSQSLQMMERPLMTPDELKSMPKGSFIVAKTGVHPMKVKLRLFLDWGIRFGMPYEVPEKAQRFVAYADKQELEESIIRRHYGTIVMDSEQPQGGGTSAGGMAQGIQAAPDSRKTVFRP